jgi:Family of unknown function (DUF5757)
MGKLIFIFLRINQFDFMMIKSVVYKRTNIIFSIGDGLSDGNLTFDNLEVSDTLKAAIRFNHGSLWYKFHYSDSFPDADKEQKNIKELDKILFTFLERKLSKPFRDTNLEELLGDGRYSKTLEDGIILVISQVFNRKRINVVLDFHNKVCSLDYHWPYKDQEFSAKDVITNVIKTGLNEDIKFDNEIKMKDIVIDIEFEEEFPRLDLLSDLIMNDNTLGFKLYERHIPRSLKSKYTLYLDVTRGIQNLHERQQQVALLFINHKSLLVRVNGLQDKFLVPEIKRKISLLVERYKEKEAELALVYDNLLGHPSTEYFKSAGKKLMEIKNLRKEVPELFIPGYSRECSVKPFIVSKERAEELKREGRRTIEYPREGPYSRIYACPKNFHPGLKINRLANKLKFSYLPVCYLTDHSLNPGSNYSNYYYEGVENTLQSSSNDDILLKEEHGVIPGMLRKILVRNGRETLKTGSPRFKSSCLYCIHSCLGKVLTESAIIDIRKSLDFNPNICLQELWYMNPEKILSMARNPDIFLDPTLYVRALESIYHLNIYVFDVNGKHDIKISIAKCPLPYIWEPIQEKSIAILCYRDAVEFPHCEYIKLDEIQSMRLREYKSDYLTLVEGPELKNPIIFDCLLSQQINDDGKCVSVVVRKDNKIKRKQCFWRPLDLPVDDFSKELVKIKHNIKNREMAYFLCDVVGILKTLVHDRVTDYFELSQEKTFFEPFVVRERFENLREYFDYYSVKLPSVFRNSKIVVDIDTYFQLKKFISSFSYSRLFFRVIKSEHFDRKNNAIIIVRKK